MHIYAQFIVVIVGAITTYKLQFASTASNYANVAAFEQVLSGSSDVAFVAYNRDVLAVQSTDVAVTIAATPTLVAPGATVSFTVTVTNTGYDASGVQIGVALPPGFTFVSGSENPSVGSYDSSTGTWSIGALADGGTVTLTLQATAGTQGGDATATLTGILNTDTNPDNNSDTASVQVLISGQDPDQATAIPTLDEVALLILACALPLIAIRRFKPPHQNTAHKG